MRNLSQFLVKTVDWFACKELVSLLRVKGRIYFGKKVVVEQRWCSPKRVHKRMYFCSVNLNSKSELNSRSIFVFTV